VATNDTYPVEMNRPVISFESYGSGRPLVIVHGWRLDGHVEQRDLEPIFDGLQGWRRIYVNLPGMGGNAPDDRIHSQDDFLEALEHFVRRLLPSGPIALAGTSTGANLVRALAHRQSGRVKGLLMRVPMLVADDAQRSGPDSLEGTQVRAQFAQQEAKKVEGLWNPARERSDEAFLRPIRSSPARYELSDPTHGGTEVKAPCLMVVGRQDDQVGYRDAIRLLEAYPRLSLAVLDRAGHALPTVNQRELFRALVREWLARVEEVWDLENKTWDVSSSLAR